MRLSPVVVVVLLALAGCDSSLPGRREGERAAGERPAREEPTHGEPTGGGPGREEPPGAEPAGEGPAREGGAAPAAGTTPTTALPVDGGRAMATLSETEMASVCAWMVENAPHRRIECEDGPTFEVGVGHDDGCPPAAMFAGCTLTVTQATSCMAENARDPCAHGMFGATVCAPFRECMLLQMGMVRDGPPPPE